MKKAIVGFLLIGFSLLLKSCNTTEPPPPPPPNGTTVFNTINLTIEWADLHRIKIKWSISLEDTLNSFRYELRRKDESGGEITKNFFISGSDTSYIDGETDSLASGKNFIYKVKAYDTNDKLIDTSKAVTAKTLSPTSHDITWDIDTLGQQGNFLYDIWGLDENNVYAVGYSTLNGSNYNIIKWNGTNWQPFSLVEGVLTDIFCFSNNNIIVVGSFGSYGFAAIWNGAIWEETNFFSYFPNGDTIWALNAVWGSSTDDIWAVGDKGTIIHWDGSEWRKIDAGISTRITAIWGISQSEIYIVPISGVQSSLYRYNGLSWEKIFDNIGIYSTTLWKAESGNLLIGGTSLLEYDGSILQEVYISGRTRGIVKVRGSEINNVFTVGDFGEITHFNGVSWINLDDFEVPDGRYRVLYSVWCTENKVFIVGVDENRAIIITGIIN
jgi:hypothetical protein